MSLPITIADDVVKKIKSQYPSERIERMYVASLELKDTKDVRVIVIPKEINYERASRSHNSILVLIDVAVMKKFSKGDADELDTWTNFVEEIIQLFDGKPLEDAMCVKVQNAPIYAQEHYEKWRQFTSLITLTFLCHESIQ